MRYNAVYVFITKTTQSKKKKQRNERIQQCTDNDDQKKFNLQSIEIKGIFFRSSFAAEKKTENFFTHKGLTLISINV
jgi:hypothetical protein